MSIQPYVTQQSHVVNSVFYMYVLSKGVGRNFSRGGLSGASGEGSPAIFQFPGGGAQPRFLVTSMVKMKEFSGQGGHGPLAYACLRPWF